MSYAPEFRPSPAEAIAQLERIGEDHEEEEEVKEEEGGGLEVIDRQGSEEGVERQEMRDRRAAALEVRESES